MAKYGDRLEAFSFCNGVNTYPEVMTPQERVFFMSRAVNRSTYRGLNDTRPPLREVKLQFPTEEDESVFQNAAISGIKFYEGEGRLFSPFLIVAVGDRIFAGYIKGNSIEFIRIYKGIDPQWQHAFFCQALNILTYNNGKDPGLYWTGDPVKQMKPIYESAYIQDQRPMPVSNIAIYAFGRIFPATENNLVYASDYIYSQGYSIESREAVLSFKESTYPSSGDGFGAPASMGAITGMIAVPQSDTLNGYGDIIVLCRNGVWSISPNRKIRNEWTTDLEMQRHIFSGKGCSSHNSISFFNNQILYRDSKTGISSLNFDIRNYQNGQGFMEISRNVEKYTSYDSNSDDIQFCCAVSTDKRHLVSTSHVRETSSSMGVHRFGSGIISSCLPQLSSSTIVCWEGLWTGIRPTGMAVAKIGNITRTYISSYDHDKKNRIYLLEENRRGNDILLQGEKRIKSKFSYSSIFSDIGEQSPISKKELKKMEAILLNSDTPAVTLSFSADQETIRIPVKLQLTENNGCNYGTYNVLSDDIQRDNSGYLFDINLEIEGIAQVGKMVIAGQNKDGGAGFQQNTCLKRDTPGFDPCNLQSYCDNINSDFDYELYGKH